MAINLSFYSLKLVKESSGRYNVAKNITDPDSIYNVLKAIELHEEAEEKLLLITLNTKNKITGIFTVSQGGLNSSIAHPREIFKRAILNNSANIIIAHNHPSGDPKPSAEDITVTKRIDEAGNLLGITLLDHIVIGDNCYVSMRERGIL
jgi:DNA repair protein RadC